MTQIVVLDPENVGAFAGSGVVIGLDISDFANTDFVTVALPAFPLSQVTLASTYLDISSDPTGNYDIDKTDSLPFSSSVTTLVQGDSQLKFPLSMLVKVDRTQITAVRFRVTVTGNCDFRAMAVRVISSNWKVAPLDINTLYNRIEVPVPLNSKIPSRTNFITNPTAASGNTTGWTNVGTMTNTAVSNSFQIANTGVSSNNLAITTSGNGLNAAVGEVWSIGAEFKANTTARNCIVEAIWKNSGGTQIGSTLFGSTVTDNSSTWTRGILENIVAPPNTAFIQIYLFIIGISPLESHFIRNIIAEKASSAGTYFDGNTLNANWNGATNASTSTLIVQSFPVQSFPDYENWPILYFADTPSSDVDPRPIDSSISMAFSTGSLVAATGSNVNRISLYLREIALAEQTQLDLNGDTQASLNALQHSLDYDRISYKPRTQTSLEPLPQLILDQHTQSSLERSEDVTTKTWIETRLEWNDTQSTLSIIEANGDGYIFTDLPDFTPNALMMIIVNLDDNEIRVKIYRIDGQGTILQPVVYDTNIIRDIQRFRRQRGRVGWYAEFKDGDAYLMNIRPRGFNFGDFRSVPYTSITPVDGAQLFVESSPDLKLFTNITSGPYGGAIFTDNVKSNSGNSYRIENRANQPFQGIQTNQFYLDDIDHTYIEFDLLFPSSALNTNTKTGGLHVLLLGENQRVFELNLPPFNPDQWSHIRIKIEKDTIQTGSYAFVVFQSVSTVDTTWYIDNISIKAITLNWSARARPQDAWDMDVSPWIDFGDKLNSLTDGVLFERGNQLQIKGEARRQDAVITQVKTIPKYAKLGNFKWPDQIDPVTDLPTPIITAINTSNRNVNLSATASTGQIAYYRWSLGDGSVAYGPYVNYTYDQSGTYTVSLTATNITGQSISTTQAVVVI